MKRQNYSTGSKWEPIIGYSRTVRVGPFVQVSGTTASGEGGALVGEGDVYAQTAQILKNIEAALRGVGAELKDVTRTRIYTTQISEWEAIGRAPGQSH